MRQVDDPRPWRLLLIVPLVVSLLLFAIPQYFFISTSFHQNLGYGRFSEAFTLANYQRIFTDSLYLAAPAVGVLVAVVTRFRAPGMALALAAAALTTLVAGAVAVGLVASDRASASIADVVMLTVMYAALFGLGAWLFTRVRVSGA